MRQGRKEHCIMIHLYDETRPATPRQDSVMCRADSRFASGQWETSLQSNAVSQSLAGCKPRIRPDVERIIKKFPRSSWLVDTTLVVSQYSPGAFSVSPGVFGGTNTTVGGTEPISPTEINMTVAALTMTLCSLSWLKKWYRTDVYYEYQKHL